MTNSWRPTASFHEACVLCGLAESTFTEAELKAFTSYWASKHESRNQVAWERAFAQRLLKQKVASVKKVTQVKNTTVDNSSAVSNTKVSANNKANAVIQNNLQSTIQNSKAEREQVQNDLASLFK